MLVSIIANSGLMHYVLSMAGTAAITNTSGGGTFFNYKAFHQPHHLVAMGGAVRVPGNVTSFGNTSSEWNLFCGSSCCEVSF